jgi:hypothetical protein
LWAGGESIEKKSDKSNSIPYKIKKNLLVPLNYGTQKPIGCVRVYTRKGALIS